MIKPRYLYFLTIIIIEVRSILSVVISSSDFLALTVQYNTLVGTIDECKSLGQKRCAQGEKVI